MAGCYHAIVQVDPGDNFDSHNFHDDADDKKGER